MRQVDAVVVGAGFAGLYMLHRLRGDGFVVQGYETGADVGGTWFWNRYPGARCDVESLDYSYGFDPALEQEWDWTERFATQPEILRYLRHVADRFDLRPLIRFDTRVDRAVWDADAARWRVTTDAGERVDARFLILATGSLSAAKAPDIAGLDTFAGQVLHTADWPVEGADLSGRRVGVIGTGSSAIQAIPLIAQDAAHLTVFQRTPAFTVPARNRPLAAEEVAARKAGYRAHRLAVRRTVPGVLWESSGKAALDLGDEERRDHYERGWQRGGPGLAATVTDAIVDEAANATLADFVREKIRATVVDPQVAESLVPTGFPIGSKRLAVDTDYYATFNRPNVTLKDLRKTPLERVEPDGIRTTDGLTGLDTIVLATGFDAMTGSFLRIDIDNGAGLTLRRKWAEGPRTYLGLLTSGFPNLFFIAGPGSPSVLSNMVLSIEQHVEWIADLLTAMRDRGQTVADAAGQSEDEWVARVNAVAARTLYMKGNSWYLGANVPGKPRVFMPFIGGVSTYRDICDDVAARGYVGIELVG
ncbi:cyclohexanone monooxygenase [Sphingomonas sp. Leaf412]|nr:cyclohexanone monooxygenase [Sphingomonas sp. Leaf412]